MSRAASIEKISARAFRIPTDSHEADGTYAWDATTLILVSASGGGKHAVGYSYGHAAAAQLINQTLAKQVVGGDAFAIDRAWNAMLVEVRNSGRSGIAAIAISAVDIALWDLKAKLLEVSLVDLLGAVRESISAYGSGGFTSYSDAQLAAQLGGWVEQGLRRVKMKVGSEPERDFERAAVARKAIGKHAELMVDANGAYTRKQALLQADAFDQLGVTWFEEPVSSDDLEGLRVLRDRAPAGMDVAAGEYGFEPLYFRRMLEAGAVDVLQADASRCLGISGFLATARLCQTFGVPLSAHCAPWLHVHAACAATPVCHIEYFHDHALIEAHYFDGVIAPHAGTLRPDRSRPGLGISPKLTDLERFAI